jgi:hypothetical protein
MKHLVFVASLFLLAASPARADLQLVRETRDDILYIDLASAQKNGNLVTAESSQDFHKMQTFSGHSYLSAKFKNEYDCATMKVRQLAINIFPENMANGGILFSEEKPQEWLPLQAGSAAESLWKSVCGK